MPEERDSKTRPPLSGRVSAGVAVRHRRGAANIIALHFGALTFGAPVSADARAADCRTGDANEMTSLGCITDGGAQRRGRRSTLARIAAPVPASQKPMSDCWASTLTVRSRINVGAMLIVL